MNKGNKAAKFGAGTYLGLIVGALAIVSLILYLTYATSADDLFMPWVVVALGLVLAGEAVLLFRDSDFLPVLICALSAAAFGCFLMDPPETIGSVVDHFQNIVMFGNPEKFGVIVALTALMLVMTVAAVIACFLQRKKPTKA